MRWVSVPEELAVPHLLDVRELSSSYRDLFAQCTTQVVHGNTDVALDLAERCYEMGKQRRDYYSSALALVLQADVYRRLQRWEECLDVIRNALHWIELQVGSVARYNEAVAVYLEGLAHYTLRAEAKLSATFSYAQHSLGEGERHWAFEQNVSRVADCRNVLRWMRQLLDVGTTLRSDDPALIVPVYEAVNRAVIRTEVFVIQPFEVMMPGEVMAHYLPPHYLPVQLDTLPFLCPRPNRHYVAIRLPEAGTVLRRARKGDLLIVEVIRSRVSSSESHLSAAQPFIRRSDGRIEFRSALGEDAPGTGLVARGSIGIPRVLIREGEEI